MDRKTELEKKAVILVTGQIINMLECDVLRDAGIEGFAGWCEDGDVFAYRDDLTEEEIQAATELMEKVAPLVDDLTYKFLNLGH